MTPSKSQLLRVQGSNQPVPSRIRSRKGRGNAAEHPGTSKSPSVASKLKNTAWQIDGVNPAQTAKDGKPKLFNDYLLSSKTIPTFTDDDSPSEVLPKRTPAINVADGLYRSGASSEPSEGSVKVFDTGPSLNELQRVE